MEESLLAVRDNRKRLGAWDANSTEQDRGNTAYAYIAGMGEELKMDSQQLSACVSMFYVGCIIKEPPATLFLKKVTARVELIGTLLTWGTFPVLYVAGCRSFLLNLRLILRLLMKLKGYAPHTLGKLLLDCVSTLEGTPDQEQKAPGLRHLDAATQPTS